MKWTAQISHGLVSPGVKDPESPVWFSKQVAAPWWTSVFLPFTFPKGTQTQRDKLLKIFSGVFSLLGHLSMSWFRAKRMEISSWRAKRTQLVHGKSTYMLWKHFDGTTKSSVLSTFQTCVRWENLSSEIEPCARNIFCVSVFLTFSSVEKKKTMTGCRKRWAAHCFWAWHQSVGNWHNNRHWWIHSSRRMVSTNASKLDSNSTRLATISYRTLQSMGWRTKTCKMTTFSSRPSQTSATKSSLFC